MSKFLIEIAFVLALQTSGGELIIQERYSPHQKIVAEYRHPDAEDPNVETDLVWLLPDEIQSEEVDRKLFIWAPPRTTQYEIILFTSIQYMEDLELADGKTRRVPGRTRIAVFRKRFSVSGDVPPPPPPTDPPPDPDPDPIPEGDLGLIRSTYQRAMAVQEPHRSRKIKDLTESFDKAARSTAIPRMSLEELAKRNRVIVPFDSSGNPTPERTAWTPWFKAWQDKLDHLLATGMVNESLTSDYRKAYEETVKGLEFAIKELGL